MSFANLAEVEVWAGCAFVSDAFNRVHPAPITDESFVNNGWVDISFLVAHLFIHGLKSIWNLLFYLFPDYFEHLFHVGLVQNTLPTTFFARLSFLVNLGAETLEARKTIHLFLDFWRHLDFFFVSCLVFHFSLFHLLSFVNCLGNCRSLLVFHRYLISIALDILHLDRLGVLSHFRC